MEEAALLSPPRPSAGDTTVLSAPAGDGAALPATVIAARAGPQQGLEGGADPAPRGSRSKALTLLAVAVPVLALLLFGRSRYDQVLPDDREWLDKQDKRHKLPKSPDVLIRSKY